MGTWAEVEEIYSGKIDEMPENDGSKTSKNHNDINPYELLSVTHLAHIIKSVC